jgi:hypothetical protein
MVTYINVFPCIAIMMTVINGKLLLIDVTMYDVHVRLCFECCYHIYVHASSPGRGGGGGGGVLLPFNFNKRPETSF